ncbi:unnamed protein product [Lactuca virosa]|uniref:No apical meristem-associated C-terminal domain-containing protein n=1 Tax=Lactuca virosa TaxID=75947 RepID=A0AAU9LQS2_9ASTR|nr:unnamed protein product [Lactuca virosa]
MKWDTNLKKRLNQTFQAIRKLDFPRHDTFSVLSSLDVFSDLLADAVVGTTSSPKKKRKHSDHVSKKSKKKKKQSKSYQLPSIPSPSISDDTLGVDLDEPTSPHKSGTTSKSLHFLDSLFQVPSAYVESSSPALVSPACFQSDIEGPSNRVSLDYDSLEDDEQAGEKQYEHEDLPKSSPVQDNQDEDTPMQTVDIPLCEGLIVDDKPNDTSVVLYSKASTRTFSNDLDNYSPSPQKESQEHDDTQEAKFCSFPLDPPQYNGTPADTNEEYTSEPEPERIRLIAQMLADGIEEIRFRTSSHFEYLDKFQGYLERMEDNLSGSNDRPPKLEGEKVNKSRSSQSPIIHQNLDSPNEFEKRRLEKLESLDKMAVDARLKAQQNRAKMAEIEKELIRKQGIKDPAL